MLRNMFRLSKHIKLKNREAVLNIKLVIEYDGSKYFGWQRQSNKPTIQQTIEESLQVFFKGEKIKLTGAGRTDTGVHALGQAANFKISREKYVKYGKERLLRSINAILAKDIAITNLNIVDNDFHSRYSAVSRNYRYYMTFRKPAFDADKQCFVKTKFDIDLAKDFCKLLIGKHSFRSLCKNREDEHNYFCHVYNAKLRKLINGRAVFEITANRFLHSMVRAIAGTMIKIASGKLSIAEFKHKFKKGETLKIQYAPSNALVLHKINY